MMGIPDYPYFAVQFKYEENFFTGEYYEVSWFTQAKELPIPVKEGPKPPRKLTVAEICDLLGEEIEIVK